jgi:hypothetical protein
MGAVEAYETTARHDASSSGTDLVNGEFRGVRRPGGPELQSSA